MESPFYTQKYVAAIQKASENEAVREQFEALKAEALKEQNESIAHMMCGTSFESKLYHKLLAAGLVEQV